jgi:phospholipid/cholesterol/gamma-HCH transport system substrate-binding protein
MNDRRMQFAVGVVALGSIFVAVILMMINSPIPSGVVPWAKGSYQITIQVPQAPGVGPDTPVRKNGVLIGRVESVDDLDDGVRVTANIDDGRTLTSRHVPHVRTSVLGDAAIDFSTGPAVADPQPLADGTVIPGVVDPNPFDSIAQLGNLQDDIQQTMRALADAGNEVARLAKRVDEAFGSDQQAGRMRRFLDTTENAMAQFAQTMNSINQIIGDEPIQSARQVPPGPLVPGQAPPAQPATEGQQLRSRLREGLAQLPEVIGDARTTLDETKTMVQSAQRNFQNLENFTKPLGERGPQVADSIVAAVQGLDTLVEEFTVLAQALNSRDGTVGQLIHNPELYRNLSILTKNADTVLRTLYTLLQRLEPTVENIRVFTDKIATEPGRLIRGAVNPSVIK